MAPQITPKPLPTTPLPQGYTWGYNARGEPWVVGPGIDPYTGKPYAGTDWGDIGFGADPYAPPAAPPPGSRKDLPSTDDPPPTPQDDPAPTTAPTTAAPAPFTSYQQTGGFRTSQGGQGNWWTGGGNDPVRPLNDPTMGAYYTQDNPLAFWRQVGQQFSGGNSQFEQFWNQNYDRYMAQFLQDAEKSENKNMTIDQWLTGAKGNQIATQFQLQAPQQRGIDRRLYDPGRFDTSY